MQHISYTLLWNFFPFPYINPSKCLHKVPLDGAEDGNLETLCSESETSAFTALRAKKEHRHSRDTCSQSACSVRDRPSLSDGQRGGRGVGIFVSRGIMKHQTDNRKIRSWCLLNDL